MAIKFITDLKVGAYVLVFEDDDESYVGKVTKVAADRAYVTYLNGNTDQLKKNHFAHTTLLPQGTYKSGPYSDAEVRQLLSKSKHGEPVAPVKAPVVKHTSNEVVLKYGNVDSDAGKMQYMKKLWALLNEKKFEGKLPTCDLRFLKDVAVTSYRRNGHWEPKNRRIAISRRLFLLPEHQFYTTFLHEMCHQAVTDLSGVLVERIKQGHGPLWEQWMRKVGLDPQRYSSHNLEDMMHGQEKEQLDEKRAEQQRQTDLRQQKINSSGRRLVPPHDLVQNTAVSWLESKTNTWVNGLLACPHTHRGSGLYWAVVPSTMASGNSFSYVPIDWLYVADADAARSMRSNDRLREKVQRVVDYYRAKGRK